MSLENHVVWDSGKVRRHPYNDRESIPDQTKLLIIGTCPPPWFERPSDSSRLIRTKDFDFFYGSKYNQLWTKILPAVFKTDFPESRDEWRSFLCSKGIWMHDILEAYKRKRDTPSDGDLIAVCFFDIKGALIKFPSIKTLILTGRRTECWMHARLIEQKLIRGDEWIIDKTVWGTRSLKVCLGGVSSFITVITCPSPTPRSCKFDLKLQLYGKALEGAGRVN